MTNKPEWKALERNTGTGNKNEENEEQGIESNNGANNNKKRGMEETTE